MTREEMMIARAEVAERDVARLRGELADAVALSEQMYRDMRARADERDVALAEVARLTAERDAAVADAEVCMALARDALRVQDHHCARAEAAEAALATARDDGGADAIWRDLRDITGANDDEPEGIRDAVRRIMCERDEAQSLVKDLRYQLHVAAPDRELVPGWLEAARDEGAAEMRERAAAFLDALASWDDVRDFTPGHPDRESAEEAYDDARDRLIETLPLRRPT